jgi:hypothetical protein
LELGGEGAAVGGWEDVAQGEEALVEGFVLGEVVGEDGRCVRFWDGMLVVAIWRFSSEME